MKTTWKFILYLAVLLIAVAFFFSLLWHQTFLSSLARVILVALITILLIRWNAAWTISCTAEWIKNLRLGLNDTTPGDVPITKGLFEPLTREMSRMASSLFEARAAAEEEARLRETGTSRWTPERLKEYTRNKMGDRKLFAISNREPYMHIRQGKQIECVVPPSGLVTALEPILRACGGTWIAQGTGNADRETVDKNDRLRVPPNELQYTLRRVWLSEEENHGFYSGFSNEGLWPLCHIAHTRPIFRSEDWDAYRIANERFAEAALEEMKDTEEPYVLVQDYHFALLPHLIKEKRPDARVALFWHIPWPNPESFGICPWQRELLHGMLGADLLGFHIQYHCNNFLDTVDRVLESRINWEHFSVSRQGHNTLIKPFPISVAGAQERNGSVPPAPGLKKSLLKKLGVQARFMGVGVDRLDYTKGIIERFRAIECFLKKNPAYVGQFTFVELCAPSRTSIKRYDDFNNEVEAEAARINDLFKTREWRPIVLLKKQHSHKEIEPFYKAADLCMVTSLHDGMNLVAKEFVAAREDDNAALILSRFTGASRELHDALFINPYDIDKVGETIRVALEMDPQEKCARMQRMRRTVRDQNIYRWASNLIRGLSEIRVAGK